MNLPTPDPAFRWSVESWGHALRCGPLEAIAQHLFTTRQLPLRSSRAAWTQAARSLGTTLDQLVMVRQVHGDSVCVVEKDSKGARRIAGDSRGMLRDPRERFGLHDWPDADAIVSNESGVVLAVRVADCVPILMADRRTGAVAAVHGGWRGTCAAIVKNAVEVMSEEFGTSPGDLVAAIGPSIGSCCYEVGEEVLSAFQRSQALDARAERWFSRTDSGSLRLDLWLATHDLLTGAGVPPEQVFNVRLCTQTHSEVFDSYRAAGQQVGRLAALIRVP